jgi:UDP-3-O-[3-hydroxymyristoyl] N-acetylglucosamine deacetylase/3-hydroxyacyl-[acyl-carrier-protein] dehydratase
LTSSAQQRTLVAPVEFHGIGLHSGAATRLTLRPAPVDFGRRFRRIDLPDSLPIPALASNVVDTARSTTLGISSDATVRTVEHLLSALAGLAVDNCLIEIDGEEIPALDGSARPFVDGLLSNGIVDQEGKARTLDIEEQIDYVDEISGSRFSFIPGGFSTICVTLDFDQFGYGRTERTYLISPDSFVNDIAGARTFCFASEIALLRRQGLIQGGRIDNALVLMDDRIVEEEVNGVFGSIIGFDRSAARSPGTPLIGGPFRFPEEPLRHKLLDLIGDLSLVGHRIRGTIVAERPGHGANVRFAHHLLRSERPHAPLVTSVTGPAAL